MCVKIGLIESQVDTFNLKDSFIIEMNLALQWDMILNLFFLILISIIHMERERERAFISK